MSTPASLRLLSDLKAITREPPDGCSASPITEDNLYVWVGGGRGGGAWTGPLGPAGPSGCGPWLAPGGARPHDHPRNLHCRAPRFWDLLTRHGAGVSGAWWCGGASVTGWPGGVPFAISRGAGNPGLTEPSRLWRREGGVFQLRITFGEHYPDKPPRVRFVSEIYHPNVYVRWCGGLAACLCVGLGGGDPWLVLSCAVGSQAEPCRGPRMPAAPRGPVPAVKIPALSPPLITCRATARCAWT